MDSHYTQFRQKINTLRYQHAVVTTGQQLLHLVMRTLIRGDINNIIGCVKETLKTSTQYKNSFPKPEQQLLEKGDHRKWDISLLFKVIQKVCGLAPAGDDCWTQPIGGDESLEFLITILKAQRNDVVHNYDVVITEDELADRLTKLTDIAVKITSALGVHAREHGRQSEKESDETVTIVLEIIEDVKQKINEGPPSSPPAAVPESVEGENDSDEEDNYESGSHQLESMYVAAGAGGQAPHGPSLEDVFKELTREFWECAGSRDVVV